MPEHRQFTRVHFELPVSLTVGKQVHTVELVDISLKGALVTLPAGTVASPTGAECRLELKLDEAPTVIRMTGHVARAAGDHVGVRCDSIDLDSATHLRRLVELNLGDTALLERELSALWEKTGPSSE